MNNDPNNPKNFPNPYKLPVIPPLPQPTTPEVPYHAVCGECGISIPKGAWGYVCGNTRCPVFPKVTCGSGGGA